MSLPIEHVDPPGAAAGPPQGVTETSLLVGAEVGLLLVARMARFATLRPKSTYVNDAPLPVSIAVPGEPASLVVPFAAMRIHCLAGSKAAGRAPPKRVALSAASA